MDIVGSSSPSSPDSERGGIEPAGGSTSEPYEQSQQSPSTSSDDDDDPTNGTLLIDDADSPRMVRTNLLKGAPLDHFEDDDMPDLEYATIPSNSGDGSSLSSHRGIIPPETIAAKSDLLFEGIPGMTISRVNSEDYSIRLENSSSEADDSDDSPDDSTAVLTRRLDEIEHEIFTESMESLRKTLTELL